MMYVVCIYIYCTIYNVVRDVSPRSSVRFGSKRPLAEFWCVPWWRVCTYVWVCGVCAFERACAYLVYADARGRKQNNKRALSREKETANDSGNDLRDDGQTARLTYNTRDVPVHTERADNIAPQLWRVWRDGVLALRR